MLHTSGRITQHLNEIYTSVTLLSTCLMPTGAPLTDRDFNDGRRSDRGSHGQGSVRSVLPEIKLVWPKVFKVPIKTIIIIIIIIILYPTSEVVYPKTPRPVLSAFSRPKKSCRLS